MSTNNPIDNRINNYLLQELLGSGSFGQVWKAKHHIFDQTVAIKIPTDPQYVRHLQREGLTVHGLKHENIVRALDLDPYADPPYLIIEYVYGPTLRRVIEENPRGLSVPVVHTVLCGLGRALSFAHRAGVIHRDIKPENILLAIGQGDVRSLEISQVKITDFGLGHVGGLTAASILQSGSLLTTAGQSLSGTIAYMSPEQRDGLGVDGRSDLYAAGIVLFEMLTGVRPQGNDLPSGIRPEIPQMYDRIFQNCYTRLEKRYSSADQILLELEQPTGYSLMDDEFEANTSSENAAIRCACCSGICEAQDHFCTTCGQELGRASRRCQTCKGLAEDSDRYCIHCGAELNVANLQ